MSFQRISFLGLPLDVGGNINDFCELLREKKTLRLVTFVGPGAWSQAANNSTYASDLERMSLVLPGGLGTVLICKLFAREKCNPLGLDVVPFAKTFFETVATLKLSLGLVGGRPGVEDDVHVKLALRYPDLKFGQTMHGFGDVKAKIATLMTKPPDVLIVGMPSPRKEAFLVALRDAGYKGFVLADSDFFDHFELYPNVMPVDTCPAWVDQNNLRSLYRLYKHPQSMWRRYVIDYPSFVIMAAKTLIDGFAETRRKTV